MITLYELLKGTRKDIIDVTQELHSQTSAQELKRAEPIKFAESEGLSITATEEITGRECS